MSMIVTSPSEKHAGIGHGVCCIVACGDAAHTPSTESRIHQLREELALGLDHGCEAAPPPKDSAAGGERKGLPPSCRDGGHVKSFQRLDVLGEDMSFVIAVI
jgi:hypothetical protein